jgi:NAD(P)-dependent dehydrogenase (short-subunit alcohol dehydrogenase family)
VPEVAAARLNSVLITGCSSGIGRATAEQLAGRGLTVFASARRLEDIGGLEARGCRLLALDVTDEDSMRAAVAAVEAATGAVGALVNNAGYSQSGAVECVSMDDVRRQFETNVFGLARMCQLVLPGMRRAHGGRIVNLSSMGGRLTFPGGGYYHATKHAVEALSDALRFEVRCFGVDVIVIEPGLIRTGFGARAADSVGAAAGDNGPYSGFEKEVARASREVYEKGPLARLGGGPDTVARVIAKALAAERPKPRYTVTPSARLFLAAHALLGDRGWDRMLRSQFPEPGSGG